MRVSLSKICSLKVSAVPAGAAQNWSTWVYCPGDWVTFLLVDARRLPTPMMDVGELTGALARDGEAATVTQLQRAMLALPPLPASAPGADTTKTGH